MTVLEKVRVGVIGCGNISAIYLKNCKAFEPLEVAACADIELDRARARAKEFDIPHALTVEELLADESIEIVVNLTIPKAHAEVSLAALTAGKHVYVEKPLAVSLEDGRRIVELSTARHLRVGAAPDTFLGAGLQTCRQLIDEGAIGTPVAATAFMMCHGHESWHPDPAFYYQIGGGPMFDMGPYYLTALVNLLGPVRRVTGSARITFPERTITSQPKHGQKITVETPTHVAGVMDFASGVVGTIVTSFDVWHAQLPCIEIYGSEGTLSVPDPNTFGGPVRLRRFDDSTWRDIPVNRRFTDNSRGLGVADMAFGLRTDRAHRANGQMALHVLEIMHGFQIASQTGRHYELSTTCDRPAPLLDAALPDCFRV